MSEWKEYKLGEIVTFQRGHDLPKDKMVNGDIPVAGSNGVIGFHNEYTLNGPGVTIGRSGNIGIPHYYPKAYWAHNTVLYIKDFKGNDPKFMYYLLKTMDFTQLNTGSAVPSLNRNHIHELPVSVPSIDEQRRIASILTSLDDKIDLLRRENATLEVMAETLFRQWFVVEAKEEWEKKSLSKCIKLIGGGTPKTSEERFWNGNVCWLSGGDIANNHKIFVFSSEKYISEDGLNNSSAKMLPENAMIVSARGTVGKYCLLSKPMAFSQSNYGILPVFDDCYFFTYLLVSYHIDELQSAAYGSVFDTITTKTFDGVSVKIPYNQNEIICFENKVAPYFEKIKCNNKQINTLIQIREGLLPRMMNGEIKV